MPYVIEEFDPTAYNPIAGIILAIVPFFAGFVIGTKTNVLVDTKKKHIILNKSVKGVVFKRTIIKYTELEYVSIFRNNTTKYYESRLFYDDSSYIDLFEIKNEQKALSRVQNISAILSISVHDLIVDDYWEDKEAPYVAPEDREISAHLSEGRRPWWQNAIAAVMYTSSICCLYLFFVVLSKYDYEFQKGMESYITLAILIGGLGVTFSLVKDCLFDFRNGQYKMIYRIGPFEYGQWKTIRKYEYISVFQRPYGVYDVKLWYNQSKHFGLGEYGDKEAALKIGKKLARKFNTNLLYTNKERVQNWIELDTIDES